jgi:peptidoglycan/xylan/chitin deacetylase (PgdA/CDA1 family)
VQVTLSFDNGPEPDATPRVLETLARSGIRATFFVLGAKLADPARRALAARAHAEGHWIGNHTKTHAVPLGLIADASVISQEILETQALIGDLAHPDRLFRPFGGGGALGPHLLNSFGLKVLREQRMTCVLWNAVPRDWKHPHGWVEVALAQCRAQPWSLVVLHDLPNRAMEHLGEFIDRVRAEGGRFRQDFPPECVPLVRGEAVRPLEPYVARA